MKRTPPHGAGTKTLTHNLDSTNQYSEKIKELTALCAELKKELESVKTENAKLIRESIRKHEYHTDDEDLEYETNNKRQSKKRRAEASPEPEKNNNNNTNTNTTNKHYTKQPSFLPKQNNVIPPIIIKSENTLQLINEIKQKINPKNKISFKLLNHNNIKVIVTTKDDKNAIIDHLKIKNRNKILLPYHTFSNNDEKNTLYVLKYFYYETPENLQNLMKENNIPSLKVRFLKDNINGPLYIVHFPHDNITLHQLNKEFSNLNEVSVKWEHFKNLKTKITQCFNCREYGHGASNCGKKYKCVRCTEDHSPTECKYQNMSDFKAQCVNCGLNHKANSKECKAFIEYTNKIKKKSNSTINKSSVPNKFISTPAPWFNPHPADFPNLTNTQDHLLKPSIPDGEKQNSTTGSSDNINKLTLAMHDFSNITNIKETTKLFTELTSKLKATNCQKTRLAILVEYTMP